MGILSSGVRRERFTTGEIRETQLGVIPDDIRARFPFYFALPYDNPVALFAWRFYVRRRCMRDKKFRAAIWEMCRQDCAFFIVTFCFIFEPRPMPRRLPFQLWTDQVVILGWLEEIFGRRPGLINKTRGIGMSWLTAAFLFHKWVFVQDCAIGVLTKDKDLLDGPDSNSLLGKFQYLFDNLPEWEKFTKSDSSTLFRLAKTTSFINVKSKAVIQGFVSTSAKLRQLRFTIIFADEFAFYERTDQEEWLVSAGGTTNCLLLVSTWNDFVDAFNRLRYEEKSSMLLIDAFWQANPERWQGAYKMEGGKVIYLDNPQYPYPAGYQFGEPDVIEEGMERSPWVDAELSMPGINRLKALRDIYGAKVCDRTNAFFSSDMRKIVKMTLKPPEVQGILDFSKGKLEILPTLKSEIRLWGGVPLKDRGPYTAFSDLAQGVGKSYSALCVFDAGGEQVLEYGTNQTDITTFASNCVAICRWLAGDNGDGWVKIDYEGGQGQQAKPYGAELMRQNYGNIHQSESKTTARFAGCEVPKFYGTTNRDAGLANFSELERAVLSSECIIRSERVYEDLRRCGFDDDGKPSFALTSAGHGDFAHAAGGAWWRARQRASLEARAEITDGPSPEKKQPFKWEKRKLWSDQFAYN